MTSTFESELQLQSWIETHVAGGLDLDGIQISYTGIGFPLTISTQLAQTMADRLQARLAQAPGRLDMGAVLADAKTHYYAEGTAPAGLALGDPMPGFEDEFHLLPEHQIGPLGPPHGAGLRAPGGGRPSYGDRDRIPGLSDPHGGMFPTQDDPLFGNRTGAGPAAGSRPDPFLRYDDPNPPFPPF